MKKILISLVSDQTIPNIQLIKEFRQEVDEFWFISTNKMEKETYSRSDAIIRSAMISKAKCRVMLVNPNALSDIENTILKFASPSYEYIVNITGGNKLMSIATLNIFREFTSRILYIPIGTSFYRQIYPRIEKPEFQFSENLKVVEYILAYGLSINSREKYASNPHEAENLMKLAIYHKGKLEKIQSINQAHTNNDPGLRAFYSGSWFEEYIFNSVKNTLKLKPSEIIYKVDIANQNSKNEYDVVFVYQNQLYVIECKAYFGSSNLKSKIENSLYKLAALDDDFGLRVNAVFITTLDLQHENPLLSNTMLNRAKDLKVGFYQFSDLINNNFITNLIK